MTVSHSRTIFFFFFFQAEDGIRDGHVTGVQTCALPICITRTVALDHGPREPLGGLSAPQTLPRDGSRDTILLDVFECVGYRYGRDGAERSEERRVGKECRSRRVPEQ